MSEKRRTGIVVIGVIVVIAAIGAAVYFLVLRRPAAPNAPVPATSNGPELRLFARAPTGTVAGKTGCKVTSIYAISSGAIPILLTCSDGKPFQVDVLRKDAQGPAPVATTNRLSFHLVTDAPGAATPEEHGLAVMALADILRADETAPLPDALLTFTQRAAKFPDGTPRAPMAVTPASTPESPRR